MFSSLHEARQWWQIRHLNCVDHTWLSESCCSFQLCYCSGKRALGRTSDYWQIAFLHLQVTTSVQNKWLQLHQHQLSLASLRCPSVRLSVCPSIGHSSNSISLCKAKLGICSSLKENSIGLSASGAWSRSRSHGQAIVSSFSYLWDEWRKHCSFGFGIVFLTEMMSFFRFWSWRIIYSLTVISLLLVYYCFSQLLLIMERWHWSVPANHVVLVRLTLDQFIFWPKLPPNAGFGIKNVKKISDDPLPHPPPARLHGNRSPKSKFTTIPTSTQKSFSKATQTFRIQEVNAPLTVARRRRKGTNLCWLP